MNARRASPPPDGSGPAETGGRPLWWAAAGTLFALLLVLLAGRLLDEETRNTALWLNGRYVFVALSAYAGWLVGIGRGRVVAENVECLAIAVVMALVLKHFLVEAYKIPTGSMQPTILGNAERGIFDRVLVNKLAYLLGEPKRYDVIVFKYPLDRSKNYIKRLVGLPGERVTLFHGDVFVAPPSPDGARPPSRIARKPDEKRDAILRRVFPTGREGERLEDGFVAARGRVTFQKDQAHLSPGARLRYRREIRNRYLDGYDPEWGIPVPVHVNPDGDLAVSDFALEATLVPEEAARSVRLVLFADGIEKRAELPVGNEGQAVVLVGRRGPEGDLLPVSGEDPVVASADGVFLEPGRETHVRFLHVDQQIVLEVDGEVATRYAYEIALDGAPGPDTWPRPEAASSLEGNEAAIEVVGAGGVVVSDLALDRDVHYRTTNGRPRQTFDVPLDGLFVLGDNTQNSSDSRLWRAARVRLPDGRTTYVDVSNHLRLTLHDAEGVRPEPIRDFVDIYGEHYVFPSGPPAELSEVEEGRFSFVPRRLLLGKAFCVFWPIWPHFRWKVIR